MNNCDKQKQVVSTREWEKTEIGGPRHYYRESLVIKTLSEVLNKGKILDVGCGGGSLAIRLAQRGFNIEGVELSYNKVVTIREKIKKVGLDRNIFINVGNAQRIECPECAFDAIVCAEVLEHIEDDHLIIREFYRVLKEGGYCIVTVPANPKLWDLNDMWSGHFRRYTKSGLSNLFDQHGFKIDKIRYFGFPILRLYHNLIYLPWVKRVINKDVALQREDLITKIGTNKKVEFLVSNLFKIDNLFSRLPFGIGLILRAKK